MNEAYYVKTEEKEHTVKIQNENKKFYSYDAELVENPTGTLVEKTITENGEYLPASDNADGYSKVTVNTPIKTLIEKTITENGEYLPASDNADGYSKVTVDVQSTGENKLPQVVDKTVTELTADDLAGCTKIEQCVFQNCTGLTSITIPNSVTSIESDAFRNCTGLTSVTFGNGVTSIGTYAFYYCTGLTSITFGNGVTSIGASAFYQCNGLTSVTIPDSVTNIGRNAFQDCTSLTSVTIEATTPPVLGNANAFTNTNNCPIYVPAASVEAYKAATKWSSLASRIFAIQE